MISVYANQTIIIDSATLTLQGMTNGVNGATQNNNTALLLVNGSTAGLELHNGTISGNTNTSTTSNGSGVNVARGSFTMTGGTISGNTTAGSGGGVYCFNNSYGDTFFTMTGGTISGNTAANGGGVYSDGYGGFTMSGTAKITGNTATSNGGGVCLGLNGANLTMEGGEISGNKANGAVGGGGVYIGSSNSSIAKTGGIIYGSDADSSLQNTATSATNGHAIWWANSSRYRNTTLGVSDNISTTNINTNWGQ
jgi:hypothetical protein